MIVINNFRAQTARKYSKLVIFDKDGTLIKDNGYVHKIVDFEWNFAGLELLKIAASNRACICVITNQSGIERDIYSKRDSVKFCKYLIRMARRINIDIKKVIICPHSARPVNQCECRKPNIGMFSKLMENPWAQNVDIIMVGNSESDLKFSENCGIPYLDVREKKAITQMNYFLEN